MKRAASGRAKCTRTLPSGSVGTNRSPTPTASTPRAPARTVSSGSPVATRRISMPNAGTSASPTAATSGMRRTTPRSVSTLRSPCPLTTRSISSALWSVASKRRTRGFGSPPMILNGTRRTLRRVPGASTSSPATPSTTGAARSVRARTASLLGRRESLWIRSSLIPGTNSGRRPGESRSASGITISTPIGAGDFLEPARLGEERGDSLVVGDGLVVVKAQTLGARHLAELESDDVARVAPVLLDRRGLGQRVLGVEDHQVGATEELRKGFDLRQIVLLVLGVGRVDDDLVVGLEPIAVGVTAVALELGPHPKPGDLVVAIRLEPHEFDRGRQSREINREERRRVLAAKGFLQLGVAAVNPDVIAGRVDRHEERKAHDVIQVRMGHERVEPLARGPAGGEDLVAEDPSPRAQVAQHVVPPARNDLHAGGVTAERMRAGEVELTVDEGRGLPWCFELSPRGAHQGRDQLSPDLDRRHGHWNRAARAPELDPQAPVKRHRMPPVPWARAGRAPRGPTGTRRGPS